MQHRVLNKKGNVFNVLSYGINKFGSNKNDKTTHAEVDAINHLPLSHKTIKINLLVIRTTRTGNLCISKPCSHCILSIPILAERKGYIIKNIYYSDEKGNILKTNLNKLNKDTDKHTSRYYRNTGFKTK